MVSFEYTIDFQNVSMKDLAKVGGKNASLGEMISKLSFFAIKVPQGFATTVEAFHDFLATANAKTKINKLLSQLNIEDLHELKSTAKKIREIILEIPFSNNFINAIENSYTKLITKIGTPNFSVAVRSSATAEDLPNASFAGQQETILNVQGIEEILVAIKQVFASLYNDRAIAYRAHHSFSQYDLGLSVGIQQMVRSDIGASGVMFTLDTESGFKDVVFITSSYGLGELLVQGAVNPDEFYVYKPSIDLQKPAVIRRNLGSKMQKMVYNEARINNFVKIIEVPLNERQKFSLTVEEIEFLAKQGIIIEQHYGCAMDIEWAKDGQTGQIYILQARPETVKNQLKGKTLERYALRKTGVVLCEGRSIGQRIGQGRARIIRDIAHINTLVKGEVLVSDMTDPDWEPVMKLAAAIVTNRGGRTCHAAIIAREIGIPAVVGCDNATEVIQDGDMITISCAEGDTGYVYHGALAFEHIKINIDTLPKLPVKIMLNIGNPENAFTFQALPNEGIGLARLEFLISNSIGIHPKALLEFDILKDELLKKTIYEKTCAYESPVAYYVERLKEGIATLAAAFNPKPVIVRLSDFKSNEYANLIGGKNYEPYEENPMIGFRGASRYAAESFKECFELECKAIRKVREEMGFKNVEVMIPFVRTVSEAKEVIKVLEGYGLIRGKHGLRLIMMCEIPANALLAQEFLEFFDGFSIGSNDLTQLTLGLDRDSQLVAEQFDERNPAVKMLLHNAIASCKKASKYIGICGQGPSDHRDFAEWLVNEGIESISLNPDSVLETLLYLAKTPNLV